MVVLLLCRLVRIPEVGMCFATVQMFKCCIACWLVKVTLEVAERLGFRAPSLLASQQLAPLSETSNALPATTCLTRYGHTLSAIIERSRSQWYQNYALKNSRSHDANHTTIQLGILKFQTLLLVVLLFICTCTYLHGVFPAFLDRNKNGYVWE